MRWSACWTAGGRARCRDAPSRRAREQWGNQPDRPSRTQSTAPETHTSACQASHSPRHERGASYGRRWCRTAPRTSRRARAPPRGASSSGSKSYRDPLRRMGWFRGLALARVVGADSHLAHLTPGWVVDPVDGCHVVLSLWLTSTVYHARHLEAKGGARPGIRERKGNSIAIHPGGPLSARPA